jgi:hypothetical protein
VFMAPDRARQRLIGGKLRVQAPGIAQDHHKDLDPHAPVPDLRPRAAPVDLGLAPRGGFKPQRGFNQPIPLGPQGTEEELDEVIAALISPRAQLFKEAPRVVVHLQGPVPEKRLMTGQQRGDRLASAIQRPGGLRQRPANGFRSQVQLPGNLALGPALAMQRLDHPPHVACDHPAFPFLLLLGKAYHAVSHLLPSCARRGKEFSIPTMRDFSGSSALLVKGRGAGFVL